MKSKNKHYLVIGGTRGIGKEIVKYLSQNHHIISVIGRRLPSQTDKLNTYTHYWSTDITSDQILRRTISKIVKKNGKINYLIFCHKYRGNDAWNGEIETSLTAVKQIIELLVDSFDSTHERSIVAISSYASFFIGLEQPVGYHVAKAGLNQLIRYFAVTLGPKGFRVNGIAPCTIAKEETKKFYKKNPKLQILYETIIPLKRMGTSKDIAGIVDFLCSSASQFITGQIIVADGGLSLVSQEALARELVSIPHASVVRHR